MEDTEKALKDIIAPIIGNRRKFFLLRVADMEVDPALNLCEVKKATYHSWLQDKTFTAIYRQRDALSSDYKQEAIKLLRRENQLAAVLLEGDIIRKIKEEVDSGEYSIIKTPLAKEVYTKLVSILDYQPSTQINTNLTWENSPMYQFLAKQGMIQGVPVPALNAGGQTDGEFTETTDIPPTEHPESEPMPEDQQTGIPDQETA